MEISPQKKLRERRWACDVSPGIFGSPRQHHTAELQRADLQRPFSAGLPMDQHLVTFHAGYKIPQALTYLSICQCSQPQRPGQNIKEWYFVFLLLYLIFPLEFIFCTNHIATRQFQKIEKNSSMVSQPLYQSALGFILFRACS